MNKTQNAFVVNKKEIAGNLYEGTTLLRPIELKIINYLAPRVPKSIETYHLTLLSSVLSLIIISAAFLSRINLAWFWLVVISLILRHLSDALDGEVGRLRSTGLIKWGFYSDHFLDFVFMCCLFIGHAIVWQKDVFIFLILIVIFSGYFIHEALSCIVLEKYNLRGYYLVGATELEYLLVIIDSIIIITRPERVWYIFLFFSLVLAYVLAKKVRETQRLFWAIDKKENHQ